MWMYPWAYTDREVTEHDREMNRCGQASAAAIREVNGLRFDVGTVAR